MERACSWQPPSAGSGMRIAPGCNSGTRSARRRDTPEADRATHLPT